jgi:hypothetical protein
VRNEKAVRELGFAPRPVSAMVADTIAWFEEAGMLSEWPAARLGRASAAWWDPGVGILPEDPLRPFRDGDGLPVDLAAGMCLIALEGVPRVSWPFRAGCGLGAT